MPWMNLVLYEVRIVDHQFSFQKGQTTLKINKHDPIICDSTSVCPGIPPTLRWTSNEIGLSAVARQAVFAPPLFALRLDSETESGRDACRFNRRPAPSPAECGGPVAPLTLSTSTAVRPSIRAPGPGGQLLGIVSSLACGMTPSRRRFCQDISEGHGATNSQQAFSFWRNKSSFWMKGILASKTSE